ncbi:YigZ family protein [Georgenia wutianyii]|uniref:YigZ family protein n=1 Tax=Georgenia wutianyii TaxID=2585135 RepID=A0ABX5VN12_9MICO|nr:YigZ family protein [Georgenia wutianyii]QDB78728.1 YigZ family protein [Georgenia wutianyii]
MDVRTLARGDATTAELEIRRSRFITWLRRADDEASARALVEEARHTYPDARHHCSAFIVRIPGANLVERSSDDGEPSGTAGMPMLEVLRGSGLVDLSAVVVRYFGGVKLGTGGLVRAYSDAVRAALDVAPVVVQRETRLHRIALPHADAGRVESELRAAGFAVEDVAYGERVTLTLATNDDAALASAVAALTGGDATPTPAGTTLTEHPE